MSGAGRCLQWISVCYLLLISWGPKLYWLLFVMKWLGVWVRRVRRKTRTIYLVLNQSTNAAELVPYSFSTLTFHLDLPLLSNSTRSTRSCQFSEIGSFRKAKQKGDWRHKLGQFSSKPIQLWGYSSTLGVLSQSLLLKFWSLINYLSVICRWQQLKTCKYASKRSVLTPHETHWRLQAFCVPAGQIHRQRGFLACCLHNQHTTNAFSLKPNCNQKWPNMMTREIKHVRCNPPVSPRSIPVCRTTSFSCVIWVHKSSSITPASLVDLPTWI